VNGLVDNFLQGVRGRLRGGHLSAQGEIGDLVPILVREAGSPDQAQVLEHISQQKAQILHGDGSSWDGKQGPPTHGYCPPPPEAD